MKKCPYCAEEIQDEAIKCRFCGEHLNKRKKWCNCLLGCLAVFILSVILFILSVYLTGAAIKFLFKKTFFFIEPDLPRRHFQLFGGSLEEFFRQFNEALRGFWERFFHSPPSGYQRVTF